VRFLLSSGALVPGFRRLSAILLLLGGPGLFGGSGLALAANPSPGGADTVAQGGTARAGTHGLGSVLAAPALLGLTARYQIQASGELGPDKLKGLKAYAMDSNTGLVAMGLGWQYQLSEPISHLRDLPGWIEPGTDLSNPTARSILGGGLSAALADRRLGLGLGLSWHNRATRFSDTESWFQGNLSVAGRVGPGEELVLSFVADNLIVPSNVESPLTFGTGMALRPIPEVGISGQVDLLTGAFDQPVELAFGMGAEGVLAETVALRGGFRRDADRDSDFATMGLGLLSPQVSLDYAAELVVGHADQAPAGWEDGKLRHQHTLSLLIQL